MAGGVSAGRCEWDEFLAGVTPEHDITNAEMFTPGPDPETSLAEAPSSAGGQGIAGFQVTFNGNHHDNMRALIGGTMWNSLSLTYSFPDATLDYTGSPGSYGNGELTSGFAAFTSTQQAAARRALDLVDDYTLLTLTEITGAQGSADIRMARSDSPSTAWAYYPGSSTGGDAWFNNSGGYYNSPTVGTYAFHTVSHELGHALGLKHGHDTSGYGALSSAFDSMEYSVMTYRSHDGSSGSFYTNEYYGYSQSYMAYDIAALQALYGVNWNHNSGNSTYSWSSSTGQMSVDGVGHNVPGSNRILSTIWDGGGTDTIDLSNYNSGITGEMKPGKFLSFSQIQKAQLAGGIWADGNVYFALAPDDDERGFIENLILGKGDDMVFGNRVANVIEGRGGADEITGKGGNDTLIGAGGKDILIGGPGDDRLEGGIGADKLKGSGGADVFVLNDRTGKDVARDFELGVDRVDVPDVGLATLTTSNTGHLTVVYQNNWMILRGMVMGDADVGDLVI